MKAYLASFNSKHDILVIDEIGKEAVNREHYISLLERVLHTREHLLGCTILISNYDCDNFFKNYGSSIYGSMLGIFKCISFVKNINLRNFK